MKFYSLLLKKVILPFADLASRQSVMKYYKFYSDSQWWDKKKLKKYQSLKLVHTLQCVHQEVPFYRSLWDQNGISINKIKSIEDLQRLPITTKKMFKIASPELCTRKINKPTQEYFTSGSSGEPFGVLLDSDSLSQARALMLLRASYSGWDIGEKVFQTGMSLQRGIVKKTKDILLLTHYRSAFDLSDKILDNFLDTIKSKKISYLMGYPGSIYYLSQRASELGVRIKLKGIVTWGDNLYKHYRFNIEKQFGCQITDTYGCGEGIQVASQCKKGNYHVFMPHVAVEITGGDGKPVPSGQTGDIILTKLSPGAMPLIRYKIGDIGYKIDRPVCDCGRGLELLGAIEGRDTDVIFTPNGNKLIVHFFTGIFEYYPSIETFKITQNQLDEIVVQIVPTSNFSMNDWDEIKHQILTKGDSKLKIKLNLVKSIPLEKSNKRRFVVSNISQK